jgi:hypothetical protein
VIRVKIVGYADDAVMMLSGPNPDLLIDQAQPYLAQALQWGKDNGLTFSSTKTVAVMFTRKKWKPDRKLTMDGSTIEFSKQVKYLGLTLTSDLSWSNHINNKIKSCKMKLMQLRAAVSICWGPRPDLMVWAFKSIVLPMLSYGALVWAHRNIPDYLVNRLTTLNRLAATGLGPMRRNTPTAGLEVILDLQPLDLVVKGDGLKAYGRLTNGKHLRTAWDGLGRLFKGHRRFWADLAVKNNISLIHEDVCALTFNWAPPFSYMLDRINPPRVRIFVAATYCERVAAVGIVVVLSVNQSLTGTIHTVMGLKLLEASTTTATLASIISCCRGLGAIDMASGVDFCMKSIPAGLGKPFVATKTVLECLAAIREIGIVSFSQPRNLWEKVMVRKALKAAELALTGDVWELLSAPPPKGTISSNVQKWTRETWTKRWTKSKGYRQTKIWFSSADQTLAKSLLQKTRIELGIRIQYLTGHGWLKSHSGVIDHSTDQLCRLCGEGDEDPDHLWRECPAIQMERSSVVGSRIVGPEYPLRWTIVQLDRFLRIPQIAELTDPDGEE